MLSRRSRGSSPPAVASAGLQDSGADQDTSAINRHADRLASIAGCLPSPQPKMPGGEKALGQSGPFVASTGRAGGDAFAAVLSELDRLLRSHQQELFGPGPVSQQLQRQIVDRLMRI
ncbi:unnamed protein product [Vitrella brassicaformis CCMP3155]|uniref:Uncharacterized protein n=1 Tax=Vitrella brassicaformis (strain CCMP3155) TaxID=1169540 RepID=A0A0G4EXJ0_VITBC|nr:unnamed protein product [Vitrella brassicaformis CCMP3155]|eukprot:CEM03314.1 unnamed protein product [Vitrella brassicaformis CCMP3155]